MQSFPTPKDYLAHLKATYAAPYADDVLSDSEFTRLTLEQIKEVGLELPASPMAGLDYAISNITSNICATDERIKKIVDDDIAIGVVENGEPNAFIARSSDGKFAVVFCSGLAIFLHKLVKLSLSLVDPKNVTYCNRTREKLKRKHVKLYIHEFIESYKRTQVPQGPLIKLSPLFSAHASGMLYMMEAFVVCHELGHFLNGDLHCEASFRALPSGAPGDRYEENLNHAIEFKADSVGFAIYKNAVAKVIDCPPEVLLAPLVFMFDAFYKLAGGASSSHPHPHDRVVNIAECHYGAGMASLMKEAMSEPKLLANIFGANGSIEY